ncbi:NADAR family protein [Ketobacter sp.]|uniref:NADAR family protein n=1 Tax=Ketobacter sp. TaxID=2083498 RepID=UPI000F286B6B|nr:NADAR family protein [Ketobacter sp.]MEE2730670.1 NADAR family protein [Pseudomonadota bacterium]RLT96756.1 MAG: NADAR family protein [Ketobacter sp.]
MSGGLFAETDLNALYFSRSDADQLLGAWSPHPFQLEAREWPTVEHYFQAMKFADPAYQEKIRRAESPKQARKLGRTRFKKIRADWRKVKVVVMTRALYTQCRTYSHKAGALLDTGDQRLVENSSYDYFWGCGRDRRGTNMYGQVLMNVRNKLRQEASDHQTP